jgi:hypothetical protein
VQRDWVKEFRLGRELVEDVQNEGRPVEVLTSETINLFEQALSDRRLKIREIAKSTVHRALYNHLHMKKNSARWVSKLFSVV